MKEGKIDSCTVCEPVQSLVTALNANGYAAYEEKCANSRSNEVLIRMEGKPQDPDRTYDVAQIDRPSYGLFICQCHWSRVYIRNFPAGAGAPPVDSEE